MTATDPESALIDALEAAITEQSGEVVAWRRHLHAHPELSFEEYETSAFVAQRLAALPGVEVTRPTETGVVGRLVGGRPGPTLAIRADMDALPIREQTGLPFTSQREGIMHACGHDGHTSILLGAAAILASVADQLPGELRFIFQPGEETLPGGAAGLVAAGAMDGVDQVIGLHLWAPIPRGTAVIRPGRLMAAVDVFEIVVHGRGGHIGAPHLAVDPIAIGAELVEALQHIVAREVDPLEPAVVGVTGFAAGGAIGIIPATATITGGANVFDPGVRALLERRIEEIADGICAAHGARAELTFTRGYSAVINDPTVAARVAEIARGALPDMTVTDGEPLMPGEDFSAYQACAPGCFVLLGAGYEADGIVPEHHHPSFDIDEAALRDGVRLFVHSALGLLRGDETPAV